VPCDWRTAKCQDVCTSLTGRRVPSASSTCSDPLHPSQSSPASTSLYQSPLIPYTGATPRLARFCIYPLLDITELRNIYFVVAPPRYIGERSIARTCQEPHVQSLPNLYCVLPVSVAHSFSNGVAICYALPVLCMTPCLPIINHIKVTQAGYSVKVRAAPKLKLKTYLY